MTTLYKYQDWTKHYVRESFIESAIYFSDSFSLNDPFDLQLPVIIDNATALSYLMTTERDHLDRDLTSAEIEYFKSFVDRYAKEYDVNNKVLFEQVHSANAEVEGKLGVLCLSRTNNCQLMWGHYANSHSGICIGYNFEGLVDHIKKTVKSRVFPLEVKYSDRVPKMDFRNMEDQDYIYDQLAQRISTKYKTWEYEQEIRIVVSYFAQRKIIIPRELITTLVIGFRMPDSERSAIQILCEKLYPHIKLFQAIPNTQLFQMDIKPLSS